MLDPTEEDEGTLGCEGKYLRRNFSSPPLVRWLSDRGLADVEPVEEDFAERLSTWFGPFDAMTLHAAQQSVESVGVWATQQDCRSRAEALRQEAERLRAGLLQETQLTDVPGGRGRRIAAPAQPTEPTPEPETEYAPYQRRYGQLQRQMEQRVAALRASVRQQLSAASPRLRQLAILDAAFDQTLDARSQRLLSGLPSLLERRFEQLHRARQAHLGAAGPAHELVGRALGGRWLALFNQEWREALAAELDCRLQPVLGMIEAMSNEV